MDFYGVLLASKLNGGGGGSSVTVESLGVTENGTYTAPTGKAYSPVTVNVGGGVPTGYTECNYIQSNGDAYIDTGVFEVPNVFTGFSGRFAGKNESSGYKGIFGYQGAPQVSNFRFLVILQADNTIAYYSASSGAGTLNGWNSDGVNDIEATVYRSGSTYPEFKINGITQTGGKPRTTSYGNAAQGDMYLLAQNYQSGGPTTNEKEVDGSYLRCYGLKLYCYNALVRDFVPCVRNADSVPGFYDLCSDEFFPSIGGNAFTYG